MSLTKGSTGSRALRATPDRTSKALREWEDQPPHGNRSVQRIRARLLLLGTYISRDNDRIARKFKISGPEMRVVFALRRIGPPFRLRPTDLFESLLVPSGTMTRQLDRLESLQLIRRQADPHDRRGSLVELTPEGVQVADAALDEALNQSVISNVLLELETSQRRELEHLLGILLERQGA